MEAVLFLYLLKLHPENVTIIQNFNLKASFKIVPDERKMTFHVDSYEISSLIFSEEYKIREPRQLQFCMVLSRLINLSPAE